MSAERIAEFKEAVTTDDRETIAALLEPRLGQRIDVSFPDGGFGVTGKHRGAELLVPLRH